MYIIKNNIYNEKSNNEATKQRVIRMNQVIKKCLDI